MHGKRVRIAVRDQMQWRDHSLEQLLPPEHPVRAVWDLVGQLDLTAFFARIRVTAHQAGTPAIDPRTLLTLWLQATLDGVGSARQLAQLCEYHLVYRWICGDAAVNYHTLSSFRVESGEELDALLTHVVAVLCHQGVACLERVAQDGMRVRAHAGAGSFRRRPTLERQVAEARAQVELLKQQVDEDKGAASRRSQAARERAAAERVARLEQALVALTQLQQAQVERAQSRTDRDRGTDPEQVRSSTTDPEARRMKMADGGYRPAYNVQFATTTHGGMIVGVAVTNAGTDAQQLPPMLEQLRRRYDRVPTAVLVDGGFAGLDAIDQVEQQGVQVLAPVKDAAKQLAAGGNPYAAKKGDRPTVAQWRERMGTPEAQEVYRQRGATAEWPNAMARQRGLQQFSVRGLAKVRVVATWFALAHNIDRAMAAGVWQ